MDVEAVYHRWKESGDEVIKRQFIAGLRQIARAVIWRILHKHSMEVESDIITLALLKSDSFRGESKFTTWFYQLATNFCYRVRRVEKRRSEVPLEVLHNDELINVPVQQTIDADLLLEELLGVLPPEEQHLLLEKLYGSTNEEIAVKFGSTKDGIKTRWKTLKRRLLKRFGAALLRR